MSQPPLIPVLAEVSAFTSRDHDLYIDGRWIASEATERLAVHNPATGKSICTTADANASDADAAVRAAHKAFVAGVWCDMPPAERERILLRFADIVEQHGEELAQIETLEQGKGIATSRAFEVGASINWIRYTAGLATKITGRTFDLSLQVPLGARYTAYTRREPLGVVAGIVPWNFPMMIGLWKVMPALASGCSIVVKPSETTPLTMLRLAELATEAGVPAGVFNVITGRGTVCGSALTTHPLVAKVSFTGSTATGKAIARGAVDRLTRVTLELGGKNPAIVLRDADPEQTIAGLVTASFLNQGQVCASCSRIYVEAPLFDTLTAALESVLKTMSVGPGLDPTAQINPLVSAQHRDKVATYIQDAENHGARLISGGQLPTGDGYYVHPTLVLDPDESLRLTREEVFGPVLTLTRVRDAEEALAFANDTELGLAASLWTTSLKSAMDLVPRIEAGTVWVNSHVMIDPNMPFGGYKQSGNGRDFGVDWLDAYSETKSVCIRH